MVVRHQPNQISGVAILPSRQAGQFLHGTFGARNVRTRLEVQQQPAVLRAHVHLGDRTPALPVASVVGEGEGSWKSIGKKYYGVAARFIEVA